MTPPKLREVHYNEVTHLFFLINKHIALFNVVLYYIT